MKAWCETCEGKGFEIEIIYEGEDMCEGKIECSDCNGNGYTEDSESDRLADIGRATEKAYKEDILLCEIMPGYEYNEREVMFKTTEELVEWAKGGK